MTNDFNQLIYIFSGRMVSGRNIGYSTLTFSVSSVREYLEVKKGVKVSCTPDGRLSHFCQSGSAVAFAPNIWIGKHTVWKSHFSNRTCMTYERNPWTPVSVVERNALTITSSRMKRTKSVVSLGSWKLLTTTISRCSRTDSTRFGSRHPMSPIHS